MQEESRRLTPRERQVFCDLADPERAPLSREEIGDTDILAMLRMARDHNVEPVVLRKLSGLDFDDVEGFDAYRRVASRDFMFLTAITRELENQAGRIAGRLEAAGIPHAIVKGMAFAKDLYPSTADRPFSDIDILVPVSVLADCERTLEDLDYVRFTRDIFDKSEANQEQKWGYQGDTTLLVELHTNLVHVPRLRRRISYGHEAFSMAGDNGKRPVAGHFATAVVHAAAGHKFHQLRLLVDVLQAARRLSDADLSHLRDVMKSLPIQPEVAMSLALMDALFRASAEERQGARIAEALRLPRSWRPVDARAVLESMHEGYWRSKIVRHAFRYYQMTLAPRRA